MPRPFLATAALLTLAATAEAAITPNSLRAVGTPIAVSLTWAAAPVTNGVYRSETKRSIRVGANRIDLTAATLYADPIAGLPNDLYFYQIGDESSCSIDDDCDDGIDCSVDRCDVVAGCVSTPTGPGTPTELAGNALLAYPHFDYVRAFNVDAPVEVALDPQRYPDIAGRTCDVYVVTARSLAEWCEDGTLTDARGAPDQRSFGATGVQAHTFPLLAPGQLSADAGTGLGVGYDVVLDCDRDGTLGAVDYIDGLSDEAGLYLVSDLTLLGPLAFSSFEELGAGPECFIEWPVEGDDIRVYYPSVLDDPGFTGTFPLVVISHGNGHCFSWYDYLLEHFASYGFIAMTHNNNTIPGIQACSLSTLRFTDRIIDEQSTLGSGVLDGHLDTGRIAWIGHSRGGEGVTRAYDRLHDEGWTPVHYTVDDVALVASIAPTDYLGVDLSNPHGTGYHLLFGAADGDVSGCAINDTRDSFNIYERAVGKKSSTYVHGADHNDFNCCGFNDFDGPPGTAIGRTEAQALAKAVYLALLQHHVRDNIPAKDFLWRQNESLKPIGVAASTVVDNDYKDAPSGQSFVVEDYQTEPALTVSSSGGVVAFDVLGLVEDLLNDTNTTFNWTAGEPMNGMTRVNTDEDPDDVQRGAVFEFSGGGDHFLELEVVAGENDFSDHRYLSLRGCQRTRHPETTLVLEDLTFGVTLLDGAGGSSTIGIGAYGGGLEEPYQRTECGRAGAGWQNEFEVIRIRLTDFLTDGTGLDLTDIVAVRLEFGPGFGSFQGAVGLDDIYLTRD